MFLYFLNDWPSPSVMEDARTSGNSSLRDRFGWKFATAVDGAPPSAVMTRGKRFAGNVNCLVMKWWYFAPGKKWLTRAKENIIRARTRLLKTSYLETEKRATTATIIYIYILRIYLAQPTEMSPAIKLDLPFEDDRPGSSHARRNTRTVNPISTAEIIFDNTFVSAALRRRRRRERPVRVLSRRVSKTRVESHPARRFGVLKYCFSRDKRLSRKVVLSTTSIIVFHKRFCFSRFLFIYIISFCCVWPRYRYVLLLFFFFCLFLNRQKWYYLNLIPLVYFCFLFTRAHVERVPNLSVAGECKVHTGWNYRTLRLVSYCLYDKYLDRNSRVYSSCRYTTNRRWKYYGENNNNYTRTRKR